MEVTKKNKYPMGIWTPIGEVLCPSCHFNCDYIEKLNELDSNEIVTNCNECGKEIALSKNIAMENNLVKSLKKEHIDAYMCQSGGMVSTCEIPKKDSKGFYWISYDVDNKGIDEFILGSYDKEGAFKYGSEVKFSSIKETVNFVLNNLKDVKEIKE